MIYALGTSLEAEQGPFACGFVRARALYARNGHLLQSERVAS